MKEKIICGIQQVGIGVRDVTEAWKWYYDTFGADVKIFEDEGVAEKMLPYTAGQPQPRKAVLVYNLRGGGGFEIWQPKGRNLNYPEKEASLGDLGIFACKIKCQNVMSTFELFKNKSLNILSNPSPSPSGTLHFFIKDPFDNVFELEEDSYCFMDIKKATGGVNGVIVGVSNMNNSLEFYSRILDYDTIVYDVTGNFEDLQGVNGGDNSFRRVMIRRSKPLQGPLSEIMGNSHIELIQNVESTTKKIFNNRLWGDPGFIHLCFDIRNMDMVEKDVNAAGCAFVCDSGKDFDMGDANGHFTYVEDPDGTLIEFVETFRIPIAKKLGLFLNLKNKDDKKFLPKPLLKMLKFLKVSAKQL